uniref:Pyruvate kinase n=1 Tax=Syphacia muris TaxID=451379 RepID=A0A0N5APA6_9BILA
MIKKGMSIARFNFSHGTHEEHAKLISTLRTAESNLGGQYNVAIALDTKGPEIRTGVLADNKVELKKGGSIVVTVDEKEKENCSEKQLFMDYKNLPRVLVEGSRIFIDDGLISLLVVKVDGDKVFCTIENGGMVGSRKGVNLPGTNIDLPDVTEKDRKDLLFGIQQDVDIVFASFARSGKGMQEIRKAMGKEGERVLLIAKIESQQGVDNADEILENCDGIMVARGDLGIEIPAQKVFLAQKKLITKCNLAGKPCICATQMLDSMIQKPRPTRAEANDVANAVLDGADCVMLSGETAGGLYPIEALTMMDAICKEAETAIFYTTYFEEILTLTTTPTSETDTIAIAATSAAHHLSAQAIICVTSTGKTAQLLSRYRPPVMVLAITRYPRVARQLRLFRGVTSICYKGERAAAWEIDLDNRIKYCTDIGKKNSILKKGDVVIVVTGPTTGEWPGEPE